MQTLNYVLKEKDIVNVNLPTGNITCTVVSVDAKDLRVTFKADEDGTLRNVPDKFVKNILK